MWADQCLNRLLAGDYQFNTVLDVGCGPGEHANAFRAAGKTVTATDLLTDGDYLHQEFAPHDLVWCSHVLEHAPNTGMFLRALAIDTKEGGILAVTVPPLKHEIVGGHVSLWNAGLLTYRLCLAGLDCSQIRLKKYGYNISAILTKRRIELPKLVWDTADLDVLRPYLPAFLKPSCNGDIETWNWN
jgi:SAM-dependent methyltransferase